MALVNSPARFKVVPAGRRSGKTERAKRYLVTKALEETEWPDAKFFAAAPTRDQAKRIYWNDLKAMVHPQLLKDKPRESDLIIKLINDAEIHVIGMDKPQRIEGSPWNGGILDEFGNMKPNAWQENIRPALSDRRGWCWMIGVPEGRNHYYDLYDKALYDETGLWAAFTWVSADILPPEEIASAKAELDEMTFAQEYEASFLTFQGRVYYTFDRNLHCSKELKYDPLAPLLFCFDFNVSPGVCAVAQEFAELPTPAKTAGTGFVGEVFIPRNSNTPAVCRRLIKDWGNHKGMVTCFGDATGGQSGSAKVAGNDWELIKRELRPVFGERLRINVPASNPYERPRVNSVNTRLKTVNGTIRMMVNPVTCKNIVRDLEGVRCLEGGSGEIDKKSDPALTHISDALGYYVSLKFPVTGQIASTEF